MSHYGKDLELKRKIEPCAQMFPKILRFKPRVLCRSRVLGSRFVPEPIFVEENLQEVVLENSKLIKQAEMHIEEHLEAVNNLNQKLTLVKNELRSKSIVTNDTNLDFTPPTQNVGDQITEIKLANEKIKEYIKIEKIKLQHSQQRYEVILPFNQQILRQIHQFSKSLLQKFELFSSSSTLPSLSQEKFLKTLKKLKIFT